jgi:hypothetical protein
MPKAEEVSYSLRIIVTTLMVTDIGDENVEDAVVTESLFL